MNVKIKFTDSPLGFDPENNCYIRALRSRYSVEFSETPQIVFYSVFGTEFLQYPNAIRIFLANEPVIPNFNDCDYAIGTAALSLGNRYFRQPPLLGYGEESVYTALHQRPPVDAQDFDRKFCNFIYSNVTNGPGAQYRVDFCRQLQRCRPVDCPGRVLNNMTGIEQRYTSAHYGEESFQSNWAAAKLAFLSDYKFTIAFENISMDGWTTEKLIHPLMAKSIPIYWGNEQAGEYFNPKAFIHCKDYGNSWEAVIQRVLELDGNRQQYLDMLSQPPLLPSYQADWEAQLAAFFARIVEGGFVPFAKNPMGYASMTARDLGVLCAGGQIGLRGLLQTVRQGFCGWFAYKQHRNG